MQIMPATGQEQMQRLGVKCSLYNPQCSVLLGSHYQHRMTSQFRRRERTEVEAHEMGLASYNCGLGCVLKAQERCNDGRLFEDINNCLPAETRNYVPKIRHYFDTLTQ